MGLAGKVGLLVLVISLGGLRLPNFGAVALANVGNLLYLQGDSAKDQVSQTLRHAYRLAPEMDTIRWRRAKYLTAEGSHEEAARLFSGMEGEAEEHPLLFADMIRAFSLNEDDDKVIALYRRAYPGLAMSQTELNDMIALAFINRAESRLRDGERQAAEEDLHAVLALRPSDLWARYHLAELEKEAPGGGKNDLRESIAHFPLEAIAPSDARLLAKTIDVIPRIVTSGYWNDETLAGVVAYLTWQAYDVAAVEELIIEVMESRPLDATVPYFLGELYLRQERLAEAKRFFERSLQISPSFRPSRWAILSVQEVQHSGSACEECAPLVKRYDEYQTAYPDDLRARYALLDRLEGSSDPEVGWNRKESKEMLALERVLPDILNVPVGSVALGPNLIYNGDLEAWNGHEPFYWLPSYQPIEQENALFFVGSDPLMAIEGENSARVLGIWVDPAGLEVPPRAGIWYARSRQTPPPALFDVTPGGLYALSFAYSAVGDARLWLNNTLFPDSLTLPETGGAVRKAIVVGINQLSNDQPVTPLFRLFSPGELVIDDVRLSEVTLENNDAPVIETIFWVSGEN